MKSPHQFDSIVLLDVLLNFLLGVIVLLFWAFIQIQPESKKDASINTAGEFAIVMDWDDKSEDDVDLYVMDSQGNLVFFDDRESGLIHLERDDLGIKNDIVIGPNGEQVKIEKNEERVIIRGITPGEYIVNAHMYKKVNWGKTTVSISLIDLQGTDAKIVEKSVVLKNKGDEVTAFRFTLNADRQVSNINTIPRKLVGLREAF